MTKADFIDWTKHPVTTQVFGQIKELIANLQEELGNTAGKDPYEDAIRVGAIRALRDVLETTYEGDDE